ncbi:MAG: LicD family protein [Bacteroidota bacterium]|nr:LicD family protein [Bacteroidota bacterium]
MSKKLLPELTKKNLQRARKILFDVVNTFDQCNIIYHLEGGTLLGLVRDGDLLPWDHDVDISIPAEEMLKMDGCFRELYKKGYKVTKRRSDIDFGPIKKGSCRILKVKPLRISILKFFHPYFRKKYIMLDIFVKTNDQKFTYWQAMRKVLKVNKRYYESYEEIEYLCKMFKVPSDYKSYLTEKYGDWSTPIENWVAGRDEKTICSD